MQWKGLMFEGVIAMGMFQYLVENQDVSLETIYYVCISEEEIPDDLVSSIYEPVGDRIWHLLECSGLGSYFGKICGVGYKYKSLHLHFDGSDDLELKVSEYLIRKELIKLIEFVAKTDIIILTSSKKVF